jgi:very-short-patch-repair endonuclease
MERFNNFIQKANNIHNGFYSYKKVNYINVRKNVVITCPTHGDFEQLPYNHLIGKGCNKCSIENNKKKFTKSSSDFINQSNIIHNNRYDYSEVDYINDGTKVDIICPHHGLFSQMPNKHLRGQGCPNCKISKTKKTNIKKYSELFPVKSSTIHNNFYDYSKINYINAKTPVDIICNKHGIFKQIPSNHLDGKGCPKCNQSRGENKIERYLIDNNIKYETQKKFDDCVKSKKLSFDFWISDKNILIEFDGLQHFYPLGFQGGLKKLEYTKECDKIKDEYCINKNIRLLRISYKEINEIDKILSSNI